MINIDYSTIFKNRVLIITGVGRSGTSIVGKIIGSLKPVYYLYEPAILKYFAMSNQQALWGTLFEDYFLNQIQGRINENPFDDSYGLNYYSIDDIFGARKHLQRRSDVIEHLRKTDPLYVIKMPEYQQWMPIERYSSITGSAKYIHVIRNGLCVIKSAVRRGWFTDEWCNSQAIENVVRKPYQLQTTIPYFKVYEDFDTDAVYDLWFEYTPLTRAACAWRVLTQVGLKFEKLNPRLCRTLYYNELFDPHVFANRISPMLSELFSDHSVSLTPLTVKHLKSIRLSESSCDISLNKIQQPERDKFEALLKELKYI